MVAKYLYDAWGNCTISSDTTNTAVANANPIRYRGYYYDEDTGLYYCNARYYSPKWRRFISPDDTSYLDPESVNGLNLYCYCVNNPVNSRCRWGVAGKARSAPNAGKNYSMSSYINKKPIISSAASASHRSTQYHLFGYERRTSTGWEYSPTMLAGPLGIIGFSSYVTHTKGRTGVLYGFAGVTSDVTSFFDKTYFAGVGIDLFGILGADIWLETVGVGASVSIGNFSISLNANLLAATSVTFAWDTDLGNDLTRTTGVTLGLNTLGLLVLVADLYLLLTCGLPLPSTLPSPIPHPII